MAIESWKRLTADERRSQLVELGQELFNSRRYADISVDDIAQAAGISKGLLYHYFPSKEEFFLAGVQHGAERLLAAVQPDSELPYVAQVIASIRGYLDYVEENSFGYLNLFRDETANLPGIQRVCEETRTRIADLLMRDFTPDVPVPATRAAFRSFQGFVEALVLRWLENDKQLERRSVEALCVTSMMSAVYSGLQLDLAATPDLIAALAPLVNEARAGLEREYGIAF